jgi:hypothetical protein
MQDELEQKFEIFLPPFYLTSYGKALAVPSKVKKCLQNATTAYVENLQMMMSRL